MEYIALKKTINQVLANKNLSLKQYNFAYKLLDNIKDDKDMQATYYHSMGKLLLKQGRYQEAKLFFLEQLFYYPKSVSCYYQFYKINIHENNFMDAYTDLFNYKQNPKVSNALEISFPLAMLEMCLDLQYKPNYFEENDYSITNTNKYMLYTFRNNECKKIYNEAIEYFNNRNFDLLYDKLTELNDYTIENNLPIDLKPIIEMCTYIKEKQKTINKIQINCLLEKKKFNSKISELLYDCIKNKKIEKKTALNCIEKLIEIGKLEQANQLLELINENYIMDNTVEMYDYLKASINEKIKYNELSSKNKKIYDECIEKGKILFQLNKFDEALECYKLGKEKTNHPIFDYYCGKIYFKKKEYSLACKYLIEYRNNNGSKILETLVYLSSIDIKLGNIKRANKTLQKIKRISNYFNKGWEVNLYKTNKNIKENDEIEDLKKEKESQNIHISENVFEEKELDIENYYNYSFYDKLELIRRLYKCNRVKLADSLLKELETESDEARYKKAIDRERRNKVLYLNQAKGKI